MSKDTKGFVPGQTTTVIVEAPDLIEGVRASIDQMLERMMTSGGDGAIGRFTWTCRAGCSHEFRLMIHDVTGEEECEACAGTGIKGSSREGGISH